MRELTEVAPAVLVTTASQYTTTSTVVVGAGGSCLVVDPAVSVAEVTGLARALGSHPLVQRAGRRAAVRHPSGRRGSPARARRADRGRSRSSPRPRSGS